MSARQFENSNHYCSIQKTFAAGRNVDFQPGTVSSTGSDARSRGIACAALNDRQCSGYGTHIANRLNLQEPIAAAPSSD